MAAVVGPVCVQDADFRLSGIALFADKIILQEPNVGAVHRKSHFPAVGLQLFAAEAGEAFHGRNVGGNVGLHLQSLRPAVVSQPRVHGIDKVVFYAP